LKTNNGAIRNYGYSFNSATGNLMSRSGMASQTETFAYDDLYRLTTAGATTMTYQSNGNIDTKTGLGKYTYAEHSAGPHAVTSVENTAGLLNTAGQEIEYSLFNRATTIIDTLGGNIYKLDIAYGPDRERIKTELRENGVLRKTVIFNGNYERVTKGDTITHLYYIGGGDGLCGIYVKQLKGTAVLKDGMYYAHTDHLGSLAIITDASGNIVQQAVFDPWGVRTFVTKDPTLVFDRGFTGHEHLDEFGLINMNARLYDPVLGRFLSPDPIVQFPDYSQSYNRYSYAFNNPLMFTDPSGEFFWIFPKISWSRCGGLSIGISVGFGIPGVASVQAGVDYSFSNSDLSAYASVSAGGVSAYVSASTQSGFSAGWSAGLSSYTGLPVSTNFTSVGFNYNFTHNTASANYMAWNVGENGWSFDPSVSVMIFPEQTTNFIRGQGFRSNEKVFQRFVANGQQQKALDYFGFKGTYDPNHELFQKYGITPGVTDPITGEIAYHNYPFEGNYDRFAYIADHEMKHSSDVLSGKYIGKTYMNTEEEYYTYLYNYKRQGYYPKPKLSEGNTIIDRINRYGVASGIYAYDFVTSNTVLFKTHWWHFIYKIPRKW
jgi:RHS repeat-associated protein